MYAVIAHSGKQYRVQESEEIVIDRLAAEVGATLDVTDVLLIGGDAVKVGTPNVDGAKVTLEVLSHDLGAKRSTFKYRRTRRSRVGRGFRPSTTTVRVQSIQA
jgi:large subunit ribosomal protein L21